jgi:hypothetical protein
MGYQDIFYTADNMIGYTGQVHKMPTVYFRKGNAWGRITQYHSNNLNIGRNVVRVKAGYTIANENVNGEEKCVERVNGKPLHTSRNRLITNDSIGEEDRAVLLQAIWKYPDEKPCGEMDSEERDAVRQQAGLKRALLEEIRNLG